MVVAYIMLRILFFCEISFLVLFIGKLIFYYNFVHAQRGARIANNFFIQTGI